MKRIIMSMVIGVALGLRRLPEETEMQLVGRQVEQGAATAMAPHKTGDRISIGLDWYYFSHFDNYFQTVDSGIDAGGSWGDIGDGMELD